MSKTILLNQNWIFSKDGHDETVTLPHTWNAMDGQDGGNDYYRGTCSYTTVLPDISLPENGRAVLQFDAVAMTAEVYLNEQKLAEHKGGYSAFCVDITDALRNGSNLLRVNVDNSDNDTVYPQKADFTFYGGIYRDVTLHIVPAAHFALAANGAVPVKIRSSCMGFYSFNVKRSQYNSASFRYDSVSVSSFNGALKYKRTFRAHCFLLKNNTACYRTDFLITAVYHYYFLIR
mgnify:CR=1 FL=1